MWEGLVWSPRGRLSTRNLLCVFATLIVAVFANLLVLTPDALAVDAEWQGSSIIYANDTYQGPNQATRNDGTELPAGSAYYVHADGGRAWVIYFAPGADPPNESSATVRTYDSRGGNLSNPRGEKTISLEPQGETAPGTTSEGTSGECNVDGIGWMVCPISNQLAGAVDSIYGFIEDFFVVQPLTDGNNSLYRVWDVMRDIANILFIIGFLVIIYSYITGGVLTNYTLKAILPRIIIAAILINVSYWICAVAVDITNITGVAFNDLFMTIRDSAIGTEKNTDIKWTEVTAYILSGGGAVAGTLAFMAVAGGSVASLWFMIVAALIGAAFAVLVALVILAARQALITIFVIIAPLAIAAYILPNTEQWFDRWRKAFITVLIIFPIFGILFGGSQLASSLIMQNAPTLAVLILGLVVQVVPLVLTPFLIQFSGGLLGRIAGMTNNTSRGLADRSKNWARDRADYHKQRALGREAGAMNLMRRGGQGFDRRRRAREDRKKNFETMAGNRYHRSQPFERLDQQRRELEHEHGNIEAGHERHWRRRFDMQDGHFDKRLFNQEVGTRLTSEQAKLAEERMNTTYQEMKSGTNPYTALGRTDTGGQQLQSQIDNVSLTARDLSLEGLKKSSAETLEGNKLTQALLEQEQLRVYAGGARGLEGADSALAKAVAKFRGDYNEKIQEKTQLMRHFNLSSSQRQQIAMGSSAADNITATRPDGTTYTFRIDDDYTKEAMIEDQLKTGSFKDIRAIVDSSGGVNKEYSLTISQAIVANGLPNKAFYWGARTIDQVSQGTYGSRESVEDAITYHVRDGKLSAEKLARQNAVAIEELLTTANTPGAINRMSAAQQADFRRRYQNVRYEAWKAVHDDQISSTADGATLEQLKRLMEEPPADYRS